eukprot:769141-Rhodomonas_salina.3
MQRLGCGAAMVHAGGALSAVVLRRVPAGHLHVGPSVGDDDDDDTDGDDTDDDDDVDDDDYVASCAMNGHDHLAVECQCICRARHAELVWRTADVMGEFVNATSTKVFAWAIAWFVLVLNLFLVFQTFAGT